jgi:hypothetical protein
MTLAEINARLAVLLVRKAELEREIAELRGVAA